MKCNKTSEKPHFSFYLLKSSKNKYFSFSVFRFRVSSSFVSSSGTDNDTLQTYQTRRVTELFQNYIWVFVNFFGFKYSFFLSVAIDVHVLVSIVKFKYYLLFLIKILLSLDSACKSKIVWIIFLDTTLKYCKTGWL